MKDITDSNMSLKIKTQAFVGLEYAEEYDKKNVVVDYSLTVEKPCFIDINRNDHTFICAMSGSGKSYLLGVIAEESIRLKSNVANTSSLLMIDRLGIFSTLDTPNKFTNQLDNWNKKTGSFYQYKPKGFDIDIWIPAGEQKKYHEDMYNAVFAIKTKCMTNYIFNYVFAIKANEPQSNLLKKCLNTIRKKDPDFTMNDLIRIVPDIQIEFGFKSQTGDALISKLETLIEMGVIDDENGIELNQMIKPGSVAVLDVSSCDPQAAKTIVNFLMDFIVSEQSRIHQLLQLAQKKGRKVYIPNYFGAVHILVDEAHNFFLNNQIFNKAVKEGRNLGIKLTAVSQSPDLDEDLYDNISHLFIGVMTGENKINYIRKYLPISEKPQAFRDSVKGLSNGRFLYYHKDNVNKYKQRIQVRPRQSLHLAVTEITDASPYLLDKPEDIRCKKIELVKSEPYLYDPTKEQNLLEPIIITEHDKEILDLKEFKEEDLKFVEEAKEEPKAEPIAEVKKTEPIPELPKIESKPELIKETPKEIKSPVKETNAVTFKENYSKQNNQCFPTIRLTDFYKPGKIYFVRFPSKTGNAKCTFTHSKKLAEIPDEFLVKDTDTKTREEAITHLKKYYPDLKAETTCYISVFCWVQFLPKDDKARKEVLQEA